ncbi:glycoside hydrolase-like protein [Mizugakiibacter sediminis]|uniref:Glucoamylase n=1 Tax=Mizugakiibacter sediminis TaxID=1475481 RepID=A0A0K8QKQ5_9GAMM|nr:glycoside hydrolase family 15 protein [Mizugakiibacter sediminis]GAP65067.1 glycoside hydrolase-like protein [Mizugakiibacter sediminis]
MNAPSLDLGIVGNGAIAALIDAQGRIVWGCFPHFDGDPAFCALLSPRHQGAGLWAVELEDFAQAEQRYLRNTAVLVTRLHDRHGGIVEITDLAPRYKQHGRIYHPMMLARRIAPVAGTPRIRMRLAPLTGYGARVPASTSGSNHVRFLLDAVTLRLTSDLPVPYVTDALPLILERPLHCVLGPDETLTRPVDDFVDELLRHTADYWREWVRYLSVPFEWQEAVIRAAITLKLCQFEDTGAIVAAVTTSIPEAPDTPRTWDYRYCWLRDAAFVVRALNRLGATRTMEEYLHYIFNLAAADGELGPVYGITYARELHERDAPDLAGYRGMGPVRIGNDAWRQRQHDIYGSVLLAASQLFFDRRLERPGDAETFARLEPLGAAAARLAGQPDAGLWEFRGTSRVHTYSAAMCWAACDRLARIAGRLGLEPRARHWRDTADRLREGIIARGFHAVRGHFVDAFDGDRLDASLLLLADIGFVRGDDPRFAATVDAIGRELRRGNYLLRYAAPDDFGLPESSFTICTYWYIDALAALGRHDEARELFEHLLARRNPLGLLSEDIDPRSGEAWGNFPQTYSLVGLVNAAMRLSRPWEEAL